MLLDEDDDVDVVVATLEILSVPCYLVSSTFCGGYALYTIRFAYKKPPFEMGFLFPGKSTIQFELKISQHRCLRVYISVYNILLADNII